MSEQRTDEKLEERQRLIDREPFRHLKITDASVLDRVQGREICPRCYKSRKFFCYTCYSPVIDPTYIPRVKLPVKIDIIKHAREIDGKSTATHAAVLAPDHVRIYTYPDFPDINSEETILIFPGRNATNVESLFEREINVNGNLYSQRIKDQIPIKKAIFIDSTWHQTKAIYKDQRLRDLRCVVLRSRISQFWRHQKKSPRWYLATVEAIHQFLVELHSCAYGTVDGYADIEGTGVEQLPQSDRRYRGQYDDLLYFFKYMYEKIHTMYDHDKLWAYKRPLI